MDYKIIQALVGHDEDVRGLATLTLAGEGSGSEGSERRVVSCSRDKSVRVWRGVGIGPKSEPAVEALIVGHEDYVTSVKCCESKIDAGEDAGSAKDYFVSTASRDKTARIWRLKYEAKASKEIEFVGSECAAILRGHNYQVTAALVLERTMAEGRDAATSLLVATASLDGVVRIWQVGKDSVEHEQEKPLQELSDHAGPVLCLCELADGSLVSGSGDTSIRLWKKESEGFACSAVLKEHSDTVRSLASLSDAPFPYISASHDTTLRAWTDAGCDKVLVGHEQIVYDVKMGRFGENGAILACSASEDCTCRVWDVETGSCLQVLDMPGCTWAAELLPKPTDATAALVATGTSDGIVRVFGNAGEGGEDLDEGLVSAFAKKVAERKASQSKAQDAAQGFSPQGLKIEDMSALGQPGSKDGQVKTVRDPADNKTYAFQWSVISLQWERLGEVVANPNDAPSAGGPSSVVAPDKMFDGKHYDYVFDVDVQDGAPPLKLPYNKNENPYEAADRFILAHSLPQSYREQVVQFIVQNTGGQSGAAGNSSAVPMDVTANVDPYARSRHTVSHHVPLESCLRFEQCKKESMMGKIKDFNASQPSEKRMGEDHLKSIDASIDASLERRALAQQGDLNPLVEGLRLALSWEKDKLFPIFDAIRVILLAKDSALVMQELMEACPLFDVVIQALAPPRPTAIEITVLRLACNACVGSPLTIQSLSAHLLNNLAECCKSKSKQVRLAWSTLLLNCAVILKDLDLDRTLVFSYTFQAAADYLDALDMDSSFRALVGLGTLMTQSEGACRDLARDLGLPALIAKAKQLGGKMSEVSSDLQNLL